MKGEIKNSPRNPELLFRKLMKTSYVTMMMIVMANFMMKVNRELMNCAFYALNLAKTVSYGTDVCHVESGHMICVVVKTPRMIICVYFVNDV